MKRNEGKIEQAAAALTVSAGAFRLTGGRPLASMIPSLLAWYPAHARALPWRQNRDPYRIWVSEIMLQQTRVDTVIPYYERFLRALPDVRALAAAPEALLYKLWEGLGYYSRVRNMQRAALEICEKHGGVFPRDPEAVRKLPGIGPYTAGAVLSIAFDERTPAVDGNVLRVLTRLCGCSENVGDASVKRKITEALAACYPVRGSGVFTQSLMELGALICQPNGAPRCTDCPVKDFCVAHAEKNETAYPVLPEKRPRRVEYYTVFLLYHDGAVAVRKRGAAGLLRGLWELPNTSGTLDADEAAAWLSENGVAFSALRRAPHQKHVFTHIEWKMTCYEADCTARTQDGALFWATPEALHREVALPTAFRKLLPNGGPLTVNFVNFL